MLGPHLVDTPIGSCGAATHRSVPRGCPVCANDVGATLFDNRMAACAGFDFSTPVLGCKCCGAAYAGRALTVPDLNRYYSTLSKYDTVRARSDISAVDSERAKLAVDFLKPHLGAIDSVLDVGCSSGLLLHELRELGVQCVQGIDPAADASTTARALFDVPVLQAQAETHDQYGNFDLVCLMAVLEHLLEPRRLLSAVGRQMRPGSRVLIEVPDAGAFDRPGDNRPIEAFGEFSNEHINFFSISDIRRLGLSAGLEVERWKTVRLSNGSADLFVLLRRAPPALELPPPDSGSSLSRLNSSEAVQYYISLSKLALEEIEVRLAAVCGAGVLIYGAGNHTARLLLQSPLLARTEVHAVFDRNHHLQGNAMGCLPILAPSRLGEFPGYPVIISTFNARHEIRASLSAATSCPALILLYD
jgi:SAM-dependent methyltransferase